jgi:hypothetical protein
MFTVNLVICLKVHNYAPAKASHNKNNSVKPVKTLLGAALVLMAFTKLLLL